MSANKNSDDSGDNIIPIKQKITKIKEEFEIEEAEHENEDWESYFDLQWQTDQDNPFYKKTIRNTTN